MTKKINHFLKEFIGLGLFLTKLFIPAKKFQVLSIYFHDPTPVLFETIVRHLYANSYKIVALQDFNILIQNKRLNEKIAIITLDDGWRNNLELLDIVRKYKVFITIFITTSAIERGNFWFEYVRKSKYQTKASVKRKKIYLKKLNETSFENEISSLKSGVILDRSALTKEEVIQLSKDPLVAIGSHSISHISLPNISAEAQKKELSDSREILEMWTGHGINYFAYPSGDYSDDLKVLLKDCGYELGFTIDPLYIDIEKVDKLAIPRMCINDDAGHYEALSKMYGIWHKLIKP
jgi:peptidoglycan/xylan/chitin deacetylase (PgdA/CDA1 family)